MFGGDVVGWRWDLGLEGDAVGEAVVDDDVFVCYLVGGRVG